MSEDDVVILIGRLLADNPNVHEGLSVGTPLAEGGLELTSLDLIQLIVDIEGELSIEIEDGTIMNSALEYVSDVIGLVFSASASAPSSKV